MEFKCTNFVENFSPSLALTATMFSDDIGSDTYYHPMVVVTFCLAVWLNYNIYVQSCYYYFCIDT